MVDYPGTLAALLFTSGCNFRCGFCHNASLISTARGIPWDALNAQCRNWREQWVDAAVVTGGEPTVAPELPALIEFLKAFGWRVKLDTNGSHPDILKDCLDSVDYVAMDVKASLATYPELTGFADVEAIGRSVGILKDAAVDYEFRTTVIESIHTAEEIEEISELIRGARRYVLQPFRPADDLPAARFRSLPRTPPQRLQDLADRVGDAVECIDIR